MAKEAKGSAGRYDDFCRKRLSIPVSDKSVVDWIEAQNNLNFSLRILIQEHIRQNGGICDPTCLQSVPSGLTQPNIETKVEPAQALPAAPTINTVESDVEEQRPVTPIADDDDDTDDEMLSFDNIRGKQPTGTTDAPDFGKQVSDVFGHKK